jgi:Tfp pilus assembly protein PilV
MGFTIMEVMMAVMVLALAIATSITTMQRSFQSIDTARNMTLAGQIMQSEIERVRLRDWSTVTGYSTAETPMTIDASFSGNSYVSNLIASRGLRLTMTASDPETDLREIKLKVYWTNVDGRTMSRTYTTYYGRYGMYDYFYNTSSS